MNQGENSVLNAQVSDGCCCQMERCSGIVTQNAGFSCQYICGCDGCGYFDPRCRDTFWPHFSHPGWLSLERLYSCEEDTCPRCT